MPFNIDQTLTDMLDAAKASVGESWNKAKPAFSMFVESRKDRLQMLAEMRISGEINDDDLKSRLEDEKLLLDSDVHVAAIMSKAAAQNAINAVMDVLQKAIMSAIK